MASSLVRIVPYNVKLCLQLILLMAGLGTICAQGADLAVLRNGFSIRYQRREVMGTVTRLYLGAQDAGYVDVPTTDIDHVEAEPKAETAPKNTPELAAVINSISGRHHLDPDLVNSVIRAESGFQANATSRRGAQGLMQLMPGTASGLGVADPFDPGANVEGGTRYLRTLLQRYNFDLIKALAAYNAGPQRVDQYRGIPPYDETQAYVARVIRDFNRQKLAERKAAALKSASYRKPAPGKTVTPSPPARPTPSPAD